MKTKLFFSILIFCISLTGCQVSDTSSDYLDENLAGVWYKVEPVETQIPSPDLRVHGWKFSSQSFWSETALGSMQPVGRNGNTAEIALIDTRYIPDIHIIDHDKMIVDHFAHPEIMIDTVRYTLTSDELILDGKYYQGTYRRAQLGTTAGDPQQSRFEVEIDGEELENIATDQITPTAYISKLSPNVIRIKARLEGKNITIELQDFDGPGTYVIGPDQGSLVRIGSDWITPPFKTQSEPSGQITIEQKDFEDNRLTGHFEFTVHAGESGSGSENEIRITGTAFDLQVFK